MRLSIHSYTEYNYAEDTRFSPHIIRLFPRPDLHSQVLQSRFIASPEALIYHQRDQFDNPVARCVYQKPSAALTFDLHLEVKVQERGAFDFLVDLHAVGFPFRYRDDELAALQPYLSQRQEEQVDVGELWTPAQGSGTVKALIDLNHAIYSGFLYERRDEGDAMLPAVTMKKHSGSCRDFSRLAASILRGRGIAVRLVSGYLAELNVTAKNRRAEGSLHAWIEAYIPGAGWLGMDPTNGSFADHQYIPTAVGLHPADIAPTWGSHSSQQDAKMTTSLHITLLE